MAATGMQITVAIDAEHIRDALMRLATFPDNRLDPAMDESGEYLVSSTVRRFHAQRDPSGNPWKQSRRAKKAGGETLIDRAMLIRSLTHNVLQGRGVEWGSPVKYARIHQLGGSFIVYPRSQKVWRHVVKEADGYQRLGKFAKKGKGQFEGWQTIGQHTVTMPKRSFLGIDAEDATQLLAIETRHLNAAIVGAKPGGAA